MKLNEYAQYDATGLAALVARGEVTPRELARLAAEAIALANPTLGAVVETYPDRIEALDETALGRGPFAGVPFLMKDVFGHEAGRRIEFGSRLCRGMVATEDTAYCTLVRAAGFNIIGRSAAPEYSMAGTTETALYGNTSTPWRQGYSAGGSSGGSAGSGGRGDRADCARIRHRRLDPHPREFLRRRRTQAFARADLLWSDARRKRLRSGAELRADAQPARHRSAARLSRRAADRRPVCHPSPDDVAGCRRWQGSSASTARRCQHRGADGRAGRSRGGGCGRAHRAVVRRTRSQRRGLHAASRRTSGDAPECSTSGFSASTCAWPPTASAAAMRSAPTHSNR